MNPTIAPITHPMTTAVGRDERLAATGYATTAAKNALEPMIAVASSQ